jgi:hypothetical protein
MRMTEIDGQSRPTQIELQSLIDAHVNNGSITFLHPTFEDALPERTMSEDSDIALADQANTAFIEQLYKHVVEKGNTELLEKNGRLNFIRGSLGYGDHRLARRLQTIRSPWEEKGDVTLSEYLGTTENQVERGDLRGRRIAEVDRFEERFNGLFTLSSILAEEVEDVIDRRVAIHTPNGKLSDVSVADALDAGYVNIAVAIALEAVRTNEGSQYNQTIPEPNDNQVVLNPNNYRPESLKRNTPQGLYDDSEDFQNIHPDDEPA